jgi:tetratricopeptide (TPR) repeat protein
MSEQDPGAALERSAREYERGDRPREAADAWAQLAAQRPLGDGRALALAEQARLLAGPLARRDEAELLFRRALACHAAQPLALDGLAVMATEAEDWACLANLNATRFRAETDASVRAEIALENGRLERLHFHSPGAARTWFREALECAPDRVEVLEELVELERERRDDASLLVALERLVELRGDANAPSELLEAASLRAARREHSRALAHLERASAQVPEDVLVLDALAEVLAALDRLPALADVLERRAALAAEEPGVRAGVLTELAVIHEERLFDPEAALDAYTRAFADAPNDAALAAAVERLRAKLDPERDETFRSPTAPAADAPETDAGRLATLEREARSVHDRRQLGKLVREIVDLHQQQGSHEAALPWVQRWTSASPEEPDALRTLARIYDRPGKEVELTATLEALDPLLDHEEQGSNRRQIGALLEARNLLPEAIRSYRRALDVEPGDIETLERLASLFRETDALEERVTVLERLLELRSPREKTSTLVEIADLYEERGDLAVAIATLEQLEAEDNAPSSTEGRIDALLERAERSEDLAERLRRRADRYDANSADAVALMLRRANLLLDTLDRPDEAADLYRAALEQAPESTEATAGLERALRGSIDATGLAQFLAVQIESATDPIARDRAILERALLLEEALEQPGEAREAYQQLAASSDDADIRREASEHFERILASQSDWDALRLYLEQAIENADRDEAELRDRLATLCGKRLRDEAGEVMHLERLAELVPTRSDVWRTLADRYQQADRTSDVVRAMEGELAAGCDAGRSLTLHAHLAEIYQNTLRDTASASEHFERVFELDPSHASAARHLIGLYEQDRRPEDVVRVLESRLAAHRDKDDAPNEQAISHRTALRVHIARVRAEQLDDVEGAISALEVALGEAGAIAQIAEPLADCYLQLEYAQDLIELCQNAAAACTESAEAANWFVRMGDAFLATERPSEAAEAYRRALTERPDDRAVQASLRAIYRQLGDSAALAPLLEAELAHLAGPDEVPVRLELAPLLAHELDRPQDALLHARRLLQLAPAHREAFDLALELADRVGEPATKLSLIDRRLEETLLRHEQVGLLDARAQILEEILDRPDDAIDTLERALALAPTAPRRRNLARLYERTERFDSLVAMLGQIARDADPADRLALFERAASLAQEHMGPQAALPWLERLRLAQPGDADVLERLAQIYREAGSLESLVRVLEQGVDAATVPAKRRSLALERATILERELRAPGRALAVLETMRSERPDDREVLERMASLQRQIGRHDDRAKTLEDWIRHRPDDAVDLHRELALLHEQLPGSESTALTHWQGAVEAADAGSAAHIETLRALADAQQRRGNLEGWAETAEEELASLGDQPVFAERRRELRRELALAYDETLARPAAALDHLRILLDDDQEEALGETVLDQLEKVALRLLREAGVPVELEARLTRHLERCTGAPELWLELARVREGQLHWTRAAIDAYRHALERDPHSLEALRGLRDAAERLGRWNDVVDAIQSELDHEDTTDPKVRSGLLRRLGDVHWHRLQSTTRASRCYAAALEVNPADFAALRALERLLESMEDWRGALDLYESEVEVLGDASPRRRREIWLRVADLARNQTGEAERARRALVKADELSPLDPDRLASLAALHLQADDRVAHAETLALWCDAPETTPTAAELLSLAHTLEDLERPDEALHFVEQALEREPDAPGAWDDAARLRERLGDAGAAARALHDAAARAGDDEAADRLRHASALLEARDAEAALEMVSSAVERNPADVRALATQARLASQLERFEEAETAAAHAFDRDLAAEIGNDEALAVAMLGGDAARERERWEAATGFYERARHLAPQHPAALAGLAESLMQLGDHPRAREALEARLASGEAYPNRAEHRAMLGRCLELEGAVEPALDAMEAALEDDPGREDALAASVRLNEALLRVDGCVHALERWSRRAPTLEQQAERLLRAAEWEIRSGEREAEAEQHLQRAVAAYPRMVRAWTLLASVLSGQGRYEAAVETADQAAQFAISDEDLATLALIQGRAYEQRGDRAEAADAFGIAAQADTRCTEGALAQARLLRGAGEWREAANALEGFLAAHPDSSDPSLADVHEQHGRLLAGPLEDVNGAVTTYRQAIHLNPQAMPARAALAELLSHRAGDHPESIEQLRRLLDAEPTHVGGIRVGLRIARTREQNLGPGPGIAILRGLGVASSYESEAEAGELLVGTPGLRDPLFEQLRTVVAEARPVLDEALGASSDIPSADVPEGEAAFRNAMFEAEGELTAKALLPLPTEELAEVVRLLVQLAIDPESVNGDGRLVNALSSALKRRTRRKLRKLIGETPVRQLCQIDFAAWRCDVRALAAATALEATGCTLRTALTSLVRENADALDPVLPEQANLTAQVETSPVALALLRRWLRDWLEGI